MCINCGDPTCDEMDLDAPLGTFGITSGADGNKMNFMVDRDREITLLAYKGSSIWAGMLQGRVEDGSAEPKYLPSISLELAGKHPFETDFINIIFTQDGLITTLRGLLGCVLNEEHTVKMMAVIRALYESQQNEEDDTKKYAANFVGMMEVWEQISEEGEITIAFPKPGVSYAKAVVAVDMDGVSNNELEDKIKELRNLELAFKAPAVGEEADGA